MNLRIAIGTTDSLLVIKKSGDDFIPDVGARIRVSVEPKNVYLIGR